MRAAVIGAGAAGLTVAAELAGAGAYVDLYERNDRAGKKLCITGKGRCNLTNNCTPAQVLENVVSNPKFLYSAINSFTPQDTMAYFRALGVPLKEERGRRVFPVSDRAADIAQALLAHARAKGVNIIYSTRVTGVNAGADGCEVIAGGVCEKYDVAVIATGGASYKATGSSGDGYAFARALGNNIITPRAALVPIYLREDVSSLAGLSLRNVTVSLRAPGKKTQSLFGEMLFMHKGVSGPVILSLSDLCRDMTNDGSFVQGSVLEIDLKPALDREKLDKRLIRELLAGHTKQMKNIMPALVPGSLISFVLAGAGIAQDMRACDITAAQRSALVGALKGLAFTPVKTGSIEEGIVTAGGVDVKEIDPRDFSDKKAGRVYFIGEVLDVDALTGGYNLQIAFSTAMACARGIIKKYSL